MPNTRVTRQFLQIPLAPVPLRRCFAGFGLLHDPENEMTLDDREGRVDNQRDSLYTNGFTVQRIGATSLFLRHRHPTDDLET